MQFDSQAKYAFMVACAALVISGAGFRVAVGHLNLYLDKEPVELREHFGTIPRSLGEWQATGQDLRHEAAMLEALGTDEYLDRAYTRRSSHGSEFMMLHIAYYTGMIDAIPHVPDRCMVAGGFEPVGLARTLDLRIDRSKWHDDPVHVNRKSGEPYSLMTFPHRITGRPVTVRMPIGEFGVRTTEFRDPNRPNNRVFAGFFFIANGHATANPLAVRSLAFDRTDRFAYYCKVQFTMVGDPTLDKERFAEAVSDMLDELLPEVMRCLPDWAEVEERSTGGRRKDDV